MTCEPGLLMPIDSPVLHDTLVDPTSDVEPQVTETDPVSDVATFTEPDVETLVDSTDSGMLLAPATLPYDEEPVYRPAAAAQGNPVSKAWFADSDSEHEVVRCNTQLFEETQLLNNENLAANAPTDSTATERENAKMLMHAIEDDMRLSTAAYQHGGPEWVKGQMRAWNRVEAQTKTDLIMAQRGWRRNRLLGCEVRSASSQGTWLEMCLAELRARKQMWFNDVNRAKEHWEMQQKQDWSPGPIPHPSPYQ